MLNQIFEWLNSLITGNISIAFAGSFIWGALSIILSPCHLASIPLVIGYINRKGIASVKNAFFNSLIFATGILLTILIIGLITSMIGGLIGDIGATGNYIVAAVFFISGLLLLDIIKIDWNTFDISKINSKGYFFAFILGIVFGFGLGPCTFAFMAPVIGIAFQYAGENIVNSILLLIAFAIGHCFLIAAAGALSPKFLKLFNVAGNSSKLTLVKKICGVLVILGGIYFIFITF